MKNNLIAISGKSGHGKDTVGQMINYLMFMDEHLEEQPDWEKEYNTETLSEKAFLDWLYQYDFKQGTHFEIKKFADPLKDMVCILLGCSREELEDRNFKEKELGDEWWSIDILGKIMSRNDTDLSKYYDHSITKLTPRSMLQKIGTDLMRNQLHPDCWINSLFSNYTPTKSIRAKCFKKANKIADNGNTLWVVPDGHGEHSGKIIPQKWFEYNLNEPKYPKWLITDLRFPNEYQAIKDRGGVCIRVFREKRNNLIDNDTHTVTDWQHDSETALDNQVFDYTIINDGSLTDLLGKVKLLLNYLDLFTGYFKFAG